MVETQVAAVVQNPGPHASLSIIPDYPIPAPKAGQVCVKLEVAGLCHSDLNRVYGPLPLIAPIVGHEGIGHIVRVGDGVDCSLISTRVGLGWLSEACLECEICDIEYTSCPNQKNLGRDLAGTFQQYVCVSSKFVHPIPEAVSSEVAAPLLCAGVTMYSAVNKIGLGSSRWLLLPGAGGGLGHLGIQIAVAKGWRVIAIDTGEDKKELCLRLGATSFLDYRENNIIKEVKNLTNGYGAHAVICTSGANAAYKMSADCVRNTGSIICVGVSPSDLPISALDMVRRGLRLVGTAVGSRDETQELLQLAAEGKTTPLLEVIDFQQIDAAAKRLHAGEVVGRLVVRIPQ